MQKTKNKQTTYVESRYHIKFDYPLLPIGSGKKNLSAPSLRLRDSSFGSQPRHGVLITLCSLFLRLTLLQPSTPFLHTSLESLDYTTLPAVGTATAVCTRKYLFMMKDDSAAHQIGAVIGCLASVTVIYRFRERAALILYPGTIVSLFSLVLSALCAGPLPLTTSSFLSRHTPPHVTL